MKECSGCKLSKSQEKFSSKQYRIEEGICKSCYDKQYRLKNLESIRKKQRENKKIKYKEDAKYRNKILSKIKDNYQLKKEKKLKYNKQYYQKNKNKILESIKCYSDNNKDKLKFYRNNYYKNLRKNNINFKLKTTISANISYYLDKKKKSTLKYLNYTIDELKKHLELQFASWMNWDNYGKYNSSKWDDNDISTWTWQIDHIIPHSTFKYQSMEDEEFKKCWSLDNLRPYSSKQNFIDGVTRVRHRK